MPRAKQDENYTYAELRKMSYRDVIALRVRLAKRANQRLLRLERSESEISGKPYKAGAYDIALQYLKESRGRDAKRFSESKNYTKEVDAETGQTSYDIYRLRRDVLELQTFIHSKSSTVSGNRDIEAKRVETFKENGIAEETATSDAFYDFLNSNAYDFFVKGDFNSETIVDIYNQYREAGLDGERIQEAFNKLKTNEMRRAKRAAKSGRDYRRTTLKDIDAKLATELEKKLDIEQRAKEKGGSVM